MLYIYHYLLLNLVARIVLIYVNDFKQGPALKINKDPFQSDEHVIFTANKQTNQNECKYQAVSVVLPRELQPVIGRIAEIVPK